METKPMSSALWSDSLKQALMARRKNDQPPRVAVVGVGHELRGDDAVGVLVAQILKPLLARSDHVLVVDGGHAPENHTGTLRRFAPALVLLVDAARMDEPPGTVRWLAWQETSGVSASTHTMPPYVLAQYLTAELGCEVAIVGIQPAHLNMDDPPSAPVQKAVVDVVASLGTALGAI
jgi:hydrogenase maturation protease HycI